MTNTKEFTRVQTSSLCTLIANRDNISNYLERYRRYVGDSRQALILLIIIIVENLDRICLQVARPLQTVNNHPFQVLGGIYTFPGVGDYTFLGITSTLESVKCILIPTKEVQDLGINNTYRSWHRPITITNEKNKLKQRLSIIQVYRQILTTKIIITLWLCLFCISIYQADALLCKYKGGTIIFCALN